MADLAYNSPGRCWCCLLCDPGVSASASQPGKAGLSTPAPKGARRPGAGGTSDRARTAAQSGRGPAQADAGCPLLLGTRQPVTTLAELSADNARAAARTPHQDD